jgi:pre-rRNA-processing protein TSR3
MIREVRTIMKSGDDLTVACSSLILRHMTAPITIIVVHPRERRAKCTVQPLRKQPGFLFYKHPRFPQELQGYVRLGLGGPVISHEDRESGLLVLDGTWRWVEPMERLVATLPIRSLPPLVTAYPRSSKVSDNPDGGLATIEAIYAAYRILGRDTTGLFDHYHWAQPFIEQNADFWPEHLSRADDSLPQTQIQ